MDLDAHDRRSTGQAARARPGGRPCRDDRRHDPRRHRRRRSAGRGDQRDGAAARRVDVRSSSSTTARRPVRRRCASSTSPIRRRPPRWSAPGNRSSSPASTSCAPHYPRFVEQLERLDWAALAVLPLLEGGELFGVVVYRWMDPVEFTPAAPRAHRDDLRARRPRAGAGPQPRPPRRLHPPAARLEPRSRQLRRRRRPRSAPAAAPAQLVHRRAVRPPARRAVRRRRDPLRRAHPGRRRSSRPTDRRPARLRPRRREADGDEEVPLDAVARDVRRGAACPPRRGGRDVRVEELPTVQGDPALLHQVLQNLIDNAAKYRDPDRPAEIVVSATAGQGRRRRRRHTMVADLGRATTGSASRRSTSPRSSTCSPGRSRAPS